MHGVDQVDPVVQSDYVQSSSFFSSIFFNVKKKRFHYYKQFTRLFLLITSEDIMWP